MNQENCSVNVEKQNLVTFSASSDDGEPSNLQMISGKAWGVLQFRKLRAFPFSVFFIVGNEFCERFSYYGMRAVLVLFLHDQLSFSENRSTAIFHTFSMLCYLFSLLGAIISDSCLGKYWTILSLSVVYCLGNITTSISAIPFENASNVNMALAIVGLTVIAFGTGGIKPCVSAFGGEQFKDGQSDLLRRFFSIFYFSINAGSLLSMVLTPILRSYINCFNTCQCFALAFGVPAVLMIIALLLFVAGTRFYVIKKPNKKAAALYLKVFASIATAIYRRIKLGKIEGKKNLLQYACPRYSEQFMEDVKLLLRVCIMLLPLPIFWALYDQQGSRWTLQATRMNGRLGNFTLPPDMMQAINAILILLFIPLFETIVYPLVGKCNLLKRPLQRMVVGMLLASFAFIIAGVVEFKVEAGDMTLKAGETKLVMFNALPSSLPTSFRIESMDTNTSFSIQPGESKVLTNSDLLTPGNYSLYVGDELGQGYLFQMVDKSITRMVLTGNTNGTVAFITDIQEDIRPDGGDSSVQVFNAFNGSDSLIIALTTRSGKTTSCSKNDFETDDLSFMDVSNQSSISPGRYWYIIYADNDNLTRISDTSDDLKPIGRGKLNLEFNSGAVYMTVVTENTGNASSLVEEGEQYKVTGVKIDEPNSVSIFLQVPMYVVITAAEVMFSITGLEFAYSQAPVSMRAMCQAMWLLTVSFGDLIVIVIAESSFFESRAIEFFFFAALIFVVTIIFAIMSFFYKYVDLSNDHGDKSSSQDSAYDSKSHDEYSALITSSSRALK